MAHLHDERPGGQVTSDPRHTIVPVSRTPTAEWTQHFTEVLEDTLFWGSAWEELNRYLHQVPDQVRRATLRQIIARADEEGEGEDARAIIGEVMDLHGLSLAWDLLTPLERRKQAAGMASTVEVIDEGGIRERVSTHRTRRAGRYLVTRWARPQATRPACRTHRTARAHHRQRAATRTGTGGDPDDGGDPAESHHHRVERPRPRTTLRTDIPNHPCPATAGHSTLGETTHA